MINWKRRLFHHDFPDRRKVRGREVGFTGRAGRVIIDDPHRLAQFEAAREPRQRLEAARAWLLKLAANGDRAAYTCDDPAIEAAVNKAIDAAACGVLVVAASMQRDLADLVGDADQAPRAEASYPESPEQALSAPALRLVIPQMKDRHNGEDAIEDWDSSWTLELPSDSRTASDARGSDWAQQLSSNCLVPSGSAGVQHVRRAQSSRSGAARIGVLMARFEVPNGWTVQAFQFALDCTPEQEGCVRRHFGGRRYARNWTVRTLKEDLARYRETGDGIKGAVDAYWNWQACRAGTRQGRRAGFPRFAKKGRDRDRVTFTTGAIRVEPDRRHVTLPRIGTVRVHENTRRLERLIAKGRARILAVTVSRKGTRLVAAFRVLIQRPVQRRVVMPGSRVGVDVGVRVLATVASSDGEVIERVPNLRPLETGLSELRRLSRERSRRTRGSRRYIETQRKITRLQRRVACIRARRRGLSDSALGETRRQLAYKTGWYGSRLIVADRWYPSSRTCHACGHVQNIGWDGHWTCAGCGARHQRDDNAAVNLARYEPPAAGDSALGPVRAAVKRRADRKTRPGRAGGDETRKGPSRQAGKQPLGEVPISDLP